MLLKESYKDGLKESDQKEVIKKELFKEIDIKKEKK